MESGGDLDELAVLPVAAGGGHFADVDLRVEVGGKGLAVAAGVGVDDVELFDHIQVLLGGQGGVDVGHARIEAAAQKGHEPGLLEALLIGPLPGVLELGGIERLVVGGIEVIDAGRQTGVHDGQVLIREGDVDHQFRLLRLDQRHQFRHIIGIDLGGLDRPVDLGGNGVALGLGAGSEGNRAEDVAPLGTFMGHDPADATGADNQYFAHLLLLKGPPYLRADGADSSESSST